MGFRIHASLADWLFVAGILVLFSLAFYRLVAIGGMAV